MEEYSAHGSFHVFCFLMLIEHTQNRHGRGVAKPVHQALQTEGYGRACTRITPARTARWEM